MPSDPGALRIVLVTVPRVSRSCEHFPDGFDQVVIVHHLLQVVISMPSDHQRPVPILSPIVIFHTKIMIIINGQ